MAIAFSAPVYERRSRRRRRESTAVSTNINTQVAFGDLSLSSQLLYAAMVETWRVVQEIAGEESVVIFEKEEEVEEQNVTDMEDGGISTGFLAEDFLTELDNMEEESEDMEQTNSNIIGGYEISKFADENNNNDDVGQSVPDLIAGSVWGETKLSGFVPDLVACCLPAGATNDQSHPHDTSLSQNSGVRQKSQPRHDTKLKQNTHKKKNSHQEHNDSLTDQDHTSTTTDTTDSTQRRDSSRVLDFKRHKNTHHKQVSKIDLEEKSQRQQEETKSSWAETGRQLNQIAKAEEKRRRIESGRPSSDFNGGSNFSALLQEEDLDPLIEKYSDVLSAIALAGISYLVRRMFN